jgi:hypothetical protein
LAEEQLSFLIADLRKFTAEETRALALDIQANLQVDTPRDTGWARANWVMSVGGPLEDEKVSQIKDPSPAQIAQAGVRQAQSASDVGQYDDTSLGAIFTTNNTPYIGVLNAGHSKRQASPGFIQRAVGRALNSREV